MNAIRRAETAPIRSEPKKLRKKVAHDKPICSAMEASPSPALITVSYMTIEIASLKIDSPNTIAYKFGFASISLKIARTDTGSVALIKLPKAKASFHVKAGESASI